MKLHYCYIESFGTLEGERFDFTDGLNVICRENGYGKSTLVGFLKAMFYGFFDTKKQNLSENDRKHYMPYSGKAASGYVVFESEGVVYRLERSFAPKGKGDVMTVYTEDGKRTDALGECPGRTLFGIDAEGFLRTVTASERTFEEANDNESISDRLSGIVGSGGDMSGAESALALLEKQRKFLQKQGGTGEIPALNAKISSLGQRIIALEEERASADRAREKLPETESECAALGERERTLNARHNDLVALTDESALIRLRAEREQRVRTLNEEKERAMHRFTRVRPSAEKLREMESKWLRLGAMKEARESDRRERLAKIKRFFIGQTDREEIEKVKTQLEGLEEEKAPAWEMSERERALDASGASAEQARAYAARGVALSLIFSLCIAIAALLVGILLHAVGYALCALAAVVGTFAFFYEKKRSNAQYGALIALCEGLGIGKNDKAALAQLAEELDAFDRKKAQHERLCREYTERREREYADIDRYIRSVASEKFADRSMAILEIRRQYENYSLLLSENTSESSDATYLALSKEVEDFLLSFEGLADAPFDALRRDLYALERAEEELSRLEKTPLPKGPDERDILARKRCEEELSSVRERREALVRELAKLESEVQRADELSVEIEELSAERTELAARRESYEKKLDVIKKTKDYLSSARDAMTSKYLSGTREEFDRILAELGESPDEFSITTSFEISKETAGSRRPLESFSRGERDLFALAARFALVRVLYPNEMPFVVLDDPFTALDDKRLALAMQYLKTLAKSTQIIYLTCSEARASV